MVFDASTGHNGDGAFVVNHRLNDRAYLDGLSNTLAFAEVKAYQANVKPGIPNGPNDPPPVSADIILGFAGSATVSGTGHTEWVDGKTHETGFTAALTPNPKVLISSGGTTYDIDLISKKESSDNTSPSGSVWIL